MEEMKQLNQINLIEILADKQDDDDSAAKMQPADEEFKDSGQQDNTVQISTSGADAISSPT